jgi:LmbE family N-acetylglucosaminyl deacetylase
MKTILAMSAHPDDESFGCGGSLLRWKAEGHTIHWAVVTTAEGAEYPQETVATLGRQIASVKSAYGFESTHFLGFATARLDIYPLTEIMEKLGGIFDTVKPTDILVPYPNDAHTDHRVTFDAAWACAKWFRCPSVRRILAYETLSETDFAPETRGAAFTPNLFVEISGQLEDKCRIIAEYETELGPHPFPRNLERVRALASLRGGQAGFEAAEAFMLLRGAE